MKRAKKSVADPRVSFKHQSLLQDYEELAKESGAKKSRLLIMESKKLTLLAEIRFLKRRFEQLTEQQPVKRQTKRDNLQQQSHGVRSVGVSKGKKIGNKESSFRYPPTSLDLNKKERNFNGVTEIASTSQQSPPIFDLNQKVKVQSGKEVGFQSSRPVFDLNQQDRTYSGKEIVARKKIQSFDLNQISGEEEELQQGNSEPLRGLLRSGSTEEQQNERKLLVCRNIGTGPSRSGKRKITWQDQVALRV